MPAENADHGRNRCIPTDIYTDVVKAHARHEGHVVRRIRVFPKVERVDRCAAEPIHARAEVADRGWAVSALFRIVVGFDAHHHERTIKTIAFYKAHIPFPHSPSPHPGDIRKLEAKVKFSEIECCASVAEDERAIVVELRFKVGVFAMEDEVITVCRLHDSHGD